MGEHVSGVVCACQNRRLSFIQDSCLIVYFLLQEETKPPLPTGPKKLDHGSCMPRSLEGNFAALILNGFADFPQLPHFSQVSQLICCHVGLSFPYECGSPALSTRRVLASHLTMGGTMVGKPGYSRGSGNLSRSQSCFSTKEASRPLSRNRLFVRLL